jgi:hypothetical protein
MNRPLRSKVSAAVFFLCIPAAVTMALPVAAIAQSAAPEMRSLEITTDGDLGAGSRLTFRVTGTPRAQTVLRIRGVRDPISLREVRQGVYVGRYTVKRGDRLADQTEVRGMLRLGNRTAASTYSIGEAMSSAPAASAPPVVVPPPVAVLPPARIERFAMAPIDRIEPGAELRFSLEGMPGAQVMVDLPGVANDVALREVRPGHYEGAYTIRRSDNLNMSRPIVATLRAGDRVTTANLALAPVPPAPPVAVDNRPPVLVNLAPREGEVVPSGPAIQISANFEDRGGSGVDPASVRIFLSGRNVTPEAQINANSFSYRTSLPPGGYTVDVSARDRAGNAVRRDWSFNVGAAVPVNIPLQILSHGNNAQVDGSPTLVEGRTAPFATLNVKVEAVAPVGGVMNVSQQILSETIQADATGRFTFSFAPRFVIPGTRYDVVIVASKANATSESTLVLYQRQR